MTEKELTIKAGEELDARLAEAKKTGNLVVPNATEDESVIRETFKKGEGILRLFPAFEKIRKSRPQTETSSGRLLCIRHGKRFHHRALVFFHHRSTERRAGEGRRGYGLRMCGL